MRIGIITDIHANLEALQAVLAVLDRAKIDRIVCLGDVVGYGADPEACCDLVRERAATTLIGNHDAGAVGRLSMMYYHEGVGLVVRAHAKLLGPKNAAWLRGLPFEDVDADAGAAYCHASPIIPESFSYLLEADAAGRCAKSREDLHGLQAVFFGHSHLPRCFEVSPDFSAKLVAQSGAIKLQPGQQYYISVPSVGQPRDFDVRAGCGVYDTTVGAFEFVRVEYDYEEAARKISAAGYPEEYAARLYRGV